MLEALGVNVAASPAVVERCLHDVGVAFFFAPTFHPAMRHAAPTRRDLGVRTAFNLLGPLTNPAGPARQIVGVPRPELTELMARALLLLGVGTRLGRARRGRARRVVDNGLHEGVGVPRRDGADVLRASGRVRTCEEQRSRTSRAAMPGRTRNACRRCWTARQDRRANVVLLNAGAGAVHRRTRRFRARRHRHGCRRDRQRAGARGAGGAGRRSRRPGRAARHERDERRPTCWRRSSRATRRVVADRRGREPMAALEARASALHAERHGLSRCPRATRREST